jgi:hypothetical protein
MNQLDLGPNVIDSSVRSFVVSRGIWPAFLETKLSTDAVISLEVAESSDIPMLLNESL